jgi:4-hydroxybenzoate polyprenyltransferase
MNLKGTHKRDALVRRFGDAGFDYAGNAAEDLHVWRSARKAIVVNPSLRLRASTVRVPNLERTFEPSSSFVRVLLRSIRPHQWMKNLLVFVPLVAAHMWADPGAALRALAEFASFCLAASGVYQVNDILDVEHDRAHPRKRSRPVASGELSIVHASLIALVVLAASVAIAWALSPSVLAVLVAYAVVTSAYSLRLKAQPIIDVVALAFLYTIRIVGGAAAIGVTPSYWLLTFSMFIFLSLAVLKRCGELVSRQGEPQETLTGRGYRSVDLPMLTSLGTSLGAAAVLVLALYINADVSARNYSRPEVLWLLCPVLVYWLAYLWLKTGRGEMHDDPIIFAARNRASLAAVATGVAIMIAATV